MDAKITRLLFDQAPIALALVDDQHRFIQCNPAAARMFGYRQEELAGMPIAQVTHPDSLQENVDLFQQLRSGQRESFEMVKRYLRKDGSTLWGRLRVSLISTDAQGVQVLGMLEDVTQQQQAMEALNRSEQRFRQILTSMYDWVWEVDLAGHFVFVSSNVEEVLGYAPDELLGRRSFDLMTAPEAQRARERFAYYVREAQPFRSLELWHRHKAGHAVLLETSGVPMIDPDGRLRGFRGVNRDITQQKHLQEELRQAHKLQVLGQMTGGIAHDFNNVLHIMSSNLHLLRECLPGQAPQCLELIDDALSASARGAELIQQLLAFARKQVLHPQRLEVAPVIEKIARLVRPTLAETIDLRIDLAAGLPALYVDPAAFETALLNLLFNARDAMRAGGEIRLRARAWGEVLEIACIDQGPGIPAATQEKVFEPFYTTKPVGQGSGLGLSMVYGFMSQIDGKLELHSEEGQGTEVRLRFPLQPPGSAD